MNQERMVMGAPPEKETKSRKGLIIFLVCIVFLLVIGIIFLRSRFTPPETQLSETTTKLPAKESLSTVTEIPASAESTEKEEPQTEPSIAQPQEKSIDPSPSAAEDIKTASERPEKLQTEESEKVQVAIAMSESKNESKYYIVQDGDTLWDISFSPDIMGDPFKWGLIFEANKNQIDNPDLIHPGQKLIIPETN